MYKISNSSFSVPSAYYRKDKDFGDLIELISRWNVSVSVLTKRRTGTLESRRSFRQVEKCVLHRVQTDSEQRTLSLGIKQPDYEAHHLSLLSRL
jgi:hypothetical protein